MTTTDATVADGAEAELAARLRDDGVVVLPEPLDPTLVAELRHAFMALLDDYVGASDTNRGPRRHQMYVPFSPPFDNPALWADPIALRVVAQVLGPDFECTYYGSDTPYPGSDYQPIHQDGGPLFPQWDPRPPAYCVALNVPLVDVDDDNGPLEWFSGHDHPEPDAEPHRFTGPAGSVLLRDTRTWHRGSPNRGSAPRPMLGLLYTRDWYHFPLDRPLLERTVYEGLPDPGPRLFRRADITPLQRRAGDHRRLDPDPS